MPWSVLHEYNKVSPLPALFILLVRELFIGMATKQPQHTQNDRLAAVDKHIEQSTLKIGKSLKALLFDEKADTEKMLGLLCSGIAGLTIAASKKRDLVTNGAKDDLSKFVVKEMERVRKQYGLKKSDVYKEEFVKTV